MRNARDSPVVSSIVVTSAGKDLCWLLLVFRTKEDIMRASERTTTTNNTAHTTWEWYTSEEEKFIREHAPANSNDRKALQAFTRKFNQRFRSGNGKKRVGYRAMRTKIHMMLMDGQKGRYWLQKRKRDKPPVKRLSLHRVSRMYGNGLR